MNTPTLDQIMRAISQAKTTSHACDAVRALFIQAAPALVQNEQSPYGQITELLKRARYVRHEDLPAEVREETEMRAAYGNSAAWQDARDTEQRRLIDEAITLLEARTK